MCWPSCSASASGWRSTSSPCGGIWTMCTGASTAASRSTRWPVALVLCASIRAILDLAEIPSDFMAAYAVFDEFGDYGRLLRWLMIALVVLFVVPAVISIVKGKLVTAALGLVYPPIGIVGAIRLAKPGSWWARHLYPTGGRRRARAD